MACFLEFYGVFVLGLFSDGIVSPVRGWGKQVASGRWLVVSGSRAGAASFFRGQILFFARFLDLDVPYRIGCWRGFFLMLGEIGAIGKEFLGVGIANFHVFLLLGMFRIG
jgi:hypothetical protein